MRRGRNQLQPNNLATAGGAVRLPFVRAHFQRSSLVLSLALAAFAPAQAQTAVSIQPPNLTGAVAGMLPGNASVSPSGASKYSIPLAIPPGTAGIVPSLSLDYSSTNAAGMVGHGWRVDGLSVITRCPKTIVQDGVRRAISLTAEDQFCLDGQRLLMLPGGTHGANAEYRLQIESFSKIVSYGSNPAKGPDRWEVYTKRGWVMTYGQTADATIEAQGKTPVLTWALSKVRDRRGNYYSIKYTESNDGILGEYYPDQIRYTGFDNGTVTRSPYNLIQFVYEDRPDKTLGFVAGARVTQSKRLKAIQARTMTAADGAGGTLVHDYRIAYQTNPTNNRSLVQSVKDCDGAGNCLPQTTFTWTVRDNSANTFSAAGSGNWGGPQASFQNENSYGLLDQQLKTQVTMGDFDGDGKPDLARGDDGGNWQVCLSRTSQFVCQPWSGPGVATKNSVSGDFNGDGKTDIAVYPQVSGTGNWLMCLSTGTGFSCSTWVGQGSIPTMWKGRVEGLLSGDFNGDGRDDIALADDINGERLCKSAGNGFENGACQPYPGAHSFMHYARLVSEETRVGFAVDRMSGDIDGDGRADYVQYAGWRTDQSIYPPGAWQGIKATDTGFVQFGAASSGRVLLGITGAGGTSRFTDFNGDSHGGLSDIVTGFVEDALTSQPQPPKVEYCRGLGSGVLSCTLLPGITNSNNYITRVGDVDGDGIPDLVSNAGVCQLRITAYGAGNADQYAYECVASTPPTLPSGTVDRYMGDFNGDGRLDLAAYVRTSDTTGYWHVDLAGHGGFVDLLSTVVNGSGLESRFVYKGAFDPAVYTPGAAVAYPKQNERPKGALVAQLRVSNAQGGWLDTDYQYGSKRVALNGRGDLGHEVTRVIDKVKNVTAENTSSQDFPYIGMSSSSSSTQANGVVLSSSTSTLASFSTAAGAVFPYVSGSVGVRRDLNGAVMSTTTQQINPTNGIDAFGNVTDVTETIDAGGEQFVTRTETTFLNNTVDHLLGLPLVTKVTKSATQTGAATSAPALSLSSCSSTGPTTSPTVATFNCSLGNSGQATATSIAYTSAAGTTVTGPSACVGLTANCGTVTVTTGSAAGTYAGTLVATPSPSGSAGSVSFSLTVNAGGTTLTRSPTSLTWSAQPFQAVGAIQTITVTNSGGSPTTLSWSYANSSGVVRVGGFNFNATGTTCSTSSALGAGASCVIAAQFTSGCTAGTRTGTLSILGAGAPTVTVAISGTTSNSGSCQ